MGERLRGVWIALLVVEMLICFGPVAYLLFIGSMFVGLASVFRLPETHGVLWLVLPAIGGVAGLVGVASLIDVLIFERFSLVSRIKTFVALAFGVLSIVAVLLIIRATLVLVPCVLALAGTAQLVYLARKQLFPRRVSMKDAQASV